MSSGLCLFVKTWLTFSNKVLHFPEANLLRPAASKLLAHYKTILAIITPESSAAQPTDGKHHWYRWNSGLPLTAAADFILKTFCFSYKTKILYFQFKKLSQDTFP